MQIFGAEFWLEVKLWQRNLMVIRQAALGDADSIALLLKEMGHQSPAEEILKRLQRLTNNHVDRVWVCEKDSRVIGFLSLHIWPRFYDWGNQDRITAMAIHSEFRRKGYGRQLIEHAEKFAQESDCVRIEVTSYSYMRLPLWSGFIDVDTIGRNARATARKDAPR
ncbi:MAG: GNAT family N-acetyltransferase [Chthoniobacterales bacterium]